MMNLSICDKDLTIESIERMDFVTMVAGLSLILISILVAANRFDIIRNFVFAGFLAIAFLLISCWRILIGRYDHDDPIKSINMYGITLSASLFVVSTMILFDAWGPIRNGGMPVLVGIVFVIIASYDTAKQMNNPGDVLTHTNVASIISGELLILYGILLHYGQVDIIWSPIYSGIFAIVLCTVSIAYGMQSVSERRYVEVTKKETGADEVILTPKKSTPKPMAIRIGDELFRDNTGMGSNDLNLSDIQKEYNAAEIAHKIYNAPNPEPIGRQKFDTSYISSEAGKPLIGAEADSHGLSEIVKNARKIKQSINESRGEW